MKIEETTRAVNIETIKWGETFRAHGSLFIMTDEENDEGDPKATCLRTGVIIAFARSRTVEPVKAKVVVEEKLDLQ